jgi:hypothetical protein
VDDATVGGAGGGGGGGGGEGLPPPPPKPITDLPGNPMTDQEIHALADDLRETSEHMAELFRKLDIALGRESFRNLADAIFRDLEKERP